MKKLLILLTLTVLISIGITNQIFAHSNYDSYHSVDNGEIRWGTYHGSTKWTTARNRGIARWDAEGIINIAGDTAYTGEDLSFTDYNAKDGNLAYYQTLYNADKIAFNDNYFNYMASCERDFASLHEIGHALDLIHNSVSGSVMNSASCQSFLGQHDKDDIRARW